MVVFRKKDLPAVAVYATARHRTGILHADGDYYDGAWFDGLEALRPSSP